MESSKLINTSTPEADYKHGCDLLNQKQFDQAIEAFDKVVEADKRYYMVYYMRGLAYLHKKYYSHAKKDFKLSAALCHHKDDSYIQLAQISETVGNYQDAETYYSKAVYQDPHTTVRQFDKNKLYPRMCRAKFYSEHLQYDKAIFDYKYVVDLIDPGYFPAYLELAKNYAKKGDYGNAVYNYYLTLERNPKEQETKDQVKEYIYAILATLKADDDLSNIDTRQLLAVIKKLSQDKQTDLLLRCLIEGEPLHTRMKQGDGLLAQGYNLIFKYDIFKDIEKYLENTLGVKLGVLQEDAAGNDAGYQMIATEAKI